jgi:hypothetical protein
VRLVTFTESDQKPRPGALQGDRVVDLSDQIGSIQELIDGGLELLLSVHDAVCKAHGQVSLTQVTLLAPILKPAAHFLPWAGLSRSCRRNASGDTEGSYYFPEAHVSVNRTAFDDRTAETHPSTWL